MLTLTGPGGTGKTRLALQAAGEVAEDVPDGVWWISLAPLRDPALALDAVAKTLDVRERPGFTLEETLVDTLAAQAGTAADRQCRAPAPAGRDDIARLRRSGGPKLLVTSRERLQLEGEHAWSGAVARRPRRGGPVHGAGAGVRPAFRRRPRPPSCVRASTTSRSHSNSRPRASRSSPRNSCSNGWGTLELRGGRDADPRQQTLDATIRWSYDLLAPEEQRLFARLAVFAGGCTYEAAEAVCAADVDTLQSLIDQSLVRSREAAGGDRYWMLETIRAFAAAELGATDEAGALRLRHAEFFTALAERADPHLRRGPDQRQWGERVAADYDNVRAAMSFALEHDLTLALRLVGRLSFFVWQRGGFAEVEAWLDAILPRAAGQPLGLLGRAHDAQPRSPSAWATSRARLDIPTRPTQRSPPPATSRGSPTPFGSKARRPRSR